MYYLLLNQQPLHQMLPAVLGPFVLLCFECCPEIPSWEEKMELFLCFLPSPLLLLQLSNVRCDYAVLRREILALAPRETM